MKATKAARPRIQTLNELRDEMVAVARGEGPAPPEARAISFESVEALTRLLTPENRRLLAVIQAQHPASLTELAHETGRALPNLTRTLGKLQAVGLVELMTDGRRTVPRVCVGRIVMEIDPCSTTGDRLRFTPPGTRGRRRGGMSAHLPHRRQRSTG